MSSLFYLFYPWGIILQGAAIVHFIRRRPDTYWLWIILFGGGLGALVYIAAEVLPDMGLLILRSRSRDESDLHNVANTAALAVLPKLTHRMHYLPTLAIVAVLLGALGTILEFRSVFLASGGSSVSGSVALGHALSPAAFGVAVAATLTLGRGYLVDQSESITVEVREFSARLINALIDRPDVRLGHR